jgi:cbb3-type cytochrome oxidase subunit 3
MFDLIIEFAVIILMLVGIIAIAYREMKQQDK